MIESDTFYYLMNIRKVDTRILNAMYKADSLRSCLYPSAIRYDKDAVQTSPSNDKMTDIMSDIELLDKEIQKLKRDKAKAIIEITDLISGLDNEFERTVLMSFFVACNSMRQTADDIGYSERRTYQFRKNGVKHLTERLSGAM